MDVLLVNSNITQCARSGYGPPPAPAGLMSLAGVLRSRGHRVKIAQVRSHVLPQDEEELPLVRSEVEDLLASFSPDVVGISVRNVGAARRPANPFVLLQYYSAFYDARAVRAFRMVSRCPIILGGTAFSIEPGLYMKAARPDFGILGEAEESLPAVLAALSAGEDPGSVPGVVQDVSDLEGERRTCAVVEDLSAIGVGACDVVEDFRGLYYDRGGFAPVQTKRGCPLNCIYCTARFLEGPAYRYRPMDQVMEEIRTYQRCWGVRHFFFVDDTFNHPVEHGVEVCDALLREGLGVQWFAEVTPACVTDELCRMMAQAGCVGVTYTPDSCSETVLRSYGKPFGMAEVRNGVRLLKKHGIPFDTCLIIGGPGETPETFRESAAFCSEHLRDDVVRFYDGMIVTTGTRLFDIAVEEDLINPSKPYEELVLHNDFRSVKRYDYFFPHFGGDRRELLDLVERVCRGPRWILTSKDYPLDPQTGELSLHPEISVQPGARPWWRGLLRKTVADEPAHS